MSERHIGRRQFLRIAGLGATAAVVAACQPEVVVETVVKEVEKVVKETVIVEGEEKVVEKVVKETVVVEVEGEEPVGYQGTIEFYAQAYTPRSADPNPDPNAPKRDVMDQLSAVWETAHPGVDIEFIPSPSGSYTDWINTQLVGGTGPDIFWLWLGSLHGFADEGKTVVLNDYLQMPNKYTDEDVAWMETFLDPFLDSRSVKGNYGGVPLDLVSTGIYTNYDALQAAGIDWETELNPDLGSPDDWVTFMEWMEKLQATGIIPFAMGGSSIDWFWRAMADQLCYNWLDEIDLLNYHEAIPMYKQEGFISQEEMQHAWWCMDWPLWELPEVQDMYRIFKDWSQYFQTNWTARDSQNAYDLFATGDAAMLWEGSWQLGPLLDDDRRDFEMVSFWLPPFTEATSAEVEDPVVLPIGAGGYGSIAYGLNHMTIERGNVDECVDWLMFITTPANDEQIVNEVPSFVPAVKGTKALPEIQNLFRSVERLVAGGHPIRSLEFVFGYAESKYNDLWHRENELYFLDQQSLEDTMANIDDMCWQQAPADIRAGAIQYSDDGSWDLTQWQCEPEI